jgi:hypothetical protein
MFTIIGADGKEYGPVTTEKIREWIAAGRANAQTQCRRDGEAAWSTIGSLPEFSPSFSGPPPVSGGSTAAAGFPSGNTTRRDIDPQAYAAAIRASGASVDVFECLSRSFKFWTSHFLPVVGATALVVVLQMVIGMVPLVGALSSLFLNGVFYGGLYYFYLGKMRGEHREIGDAFAGFKRALGPLVLSSLLQSGILIALFLAVTAPLFGAAVLAAIATGGNLDEFPQLAAPAIAYLGIGGLVMLYFAISFSFAFALVIDKGLGPWDALVTSWRVVTRNWFAVFFTILLGAILGLLGLLGLFIGVLLTIPLTIGAVLYAYEMLFSTPEAEAYLRSKENRS